MARLTPTHLRCEYHDEPLGMDVANPRLSWILESDDSTTRGLRQAAWQVLVAGSPENLDAGQGDLWESGRIESGQTTQVIYDGRPLRSGERVWWRVRVWDQNGNRGESTPARWSMGLLHPEDWKAEWITGYAPSPLLRKEFAVGRPVRHATLYVSALGLAEPSLNGAPVTGDLFLPGWTDYHKRVYYRTYDVTDRVAQGPNVLGAMLAPGWYSGFVGYLDPGTWGRLPWLRMQLNLEYEDGATETIGTDGSWQAAGGPIQFADLLMGETYDARLELPGWDAPGFIPTAAWQPADTWASVHRSMPDRKPTGRVEAHPGVPVRRTVELPARTVNAPRPGVFVFDLGQNLTGRVRLKVHGPAGARVALRHAEMLNPDGTLYTANLRRARATDLYTLKGGGEETWEPRFTFHGFRYVELTGWPGQETPPLEAVTGIVTHSDTPLAGRFECSNPLLNQLMHNIEWGQRGNFLEVPTDCPQRDERLGWTGDAQVFIATAARTMDTAAFYTKWLIDLEDAQRADGAYSHVAPDIPGVGHGSPAWADAGVICPWTLWQAYGDTRVIERHWPAMARYMDYLTTTSHDLLRPAEGYGDWLSIQAETPKDVIATAYFAWSATRMAKMARALGKTPEAEHYERLAADVRAAFNRAYVAEDGRIKGDTQTDYVLALHMDLLPEPLRPQALEHLVRLLADRDNHLSTGFVGVSYLNPVLTRFGRPDLAWRLLLNQTFPSWLYPVRHGATTIWERWDGWTEDKGFQDPGMNSFNHYAYGSIGDWIWGNVAGIQAVEPGYTRVRIQPRPGGDVTWCRARYDSIRGPIAVDWRLEDGRLKLVVDIPPNVAATVHVPTRDAASVTENGTSPQGVRSVRPLSHEPGWAVIEIGSGHYEFESPM